MIITTSICSNYLPKARVLGRSIKKHIKDATFLVCLTERSIPEFAYDIIRDGDIDEIVLSKDLGLGDDFNRFMFKHKIVEASTSVKGMLMKHLYDRYQLENHFVYLDPDCVVFSDFIELKALLAKRPIVICPHLLHPGHIDMEISSIKYGVYQLGFLAVNRCEEAVKFINWWAERLYLYCYDDLKRGLFTDQRWIDLAPTFFDVEILKHYGYDFGTWAVKDVTITKNNNSYYINNQPLRFAHFSGYDSGTIEMVMRWWLTDKNEDCYKELIKEYTAELDICGQAKYGKTKWTYAHYENGQFISDDARIKYREENKLRWSIDDPYKYSDTELSKMLGMPISSSEPEWAKNLKKAIDIWSSQGLKYLSKKLIKKVLLRR